MENVSPSGWNFSPVYRSSTPLHDRAFCQSAFSNELSSIMETSNSCSPLGENRGLKRRLFHDDPPKPSHPLAISTPNAKRIIPTGTFKTPAPKFQESKEPLEDPPNQIWSASQMDAFFLAVEELGKDFPAVKRKMGLILSGQLGPLAKTKSLTDVEVFFRYAVQQVSKRINIPSTSLAFQIYAVVNYGVWNTRFGAKLTDRDALYFKELFLTGSVTCPPRRKTKEGDQLSADVSSVRIKTPDCKVLRKLHHGEDCRLPPLVQVVLKPRSSVTYLNVSSSGRSPRICVKLNVYHHFKYLVEFLRHHWRSSDKPSNADSAELVIRPLNDSAVHFPPAMPDFETLRTGGFCWLAYERLVKRFPNYNEQNGGPPEAAVMPEKPIVYQKKQALFIDSDDSDEDSSEDSTVVEAIVPGAKFDPRVLYKEYFDERGRLAWNSSRHGLVTLAEIYMIAGSGGMLSLEYDWLLPGDVTLDLPFQVFDNSGLSALSRMRLDLKDPPSTVPRALPPSDAAANPIEPCSSAQEYHQESAPVASCSAVEQAGSPMSSALPQPQMFRTGQFLPFQLPGEEEKNYEVLLVRLDEQDHSKDLHAINVNGQLYMIDLSTNPDASNQGKTGRESVESASSRNANKPKARGTRSSSRGKSSTTSASRKGALVEIRPKAAN